VQNNRRLLAALACAVACHASHADRSRLGEEDVANPGECEVELGVERQTAHRSATERETAAQLDCGIGWRTELTVASARRRSSGERADSFDIEARTGLADRAIGGIAWSLAYGVSAERDARGPWRRSAHFVALEGALRPAGAWVVEARVGWQRERLERREAWGWLLAVEHELSDRFEVRAELDDDSRSQPLAGIESRYEFWPDRARLNLSYAARAGRSHERRLGVGVAFEF